MQCEVTLGPSVTMSELCVSASCREIVHFDYVSGLGVSKSAATMDDDALTALLWKKCNLTVDPEAHLKTSLSPEKQIMRLRMLAPLIAVTATQVLLPVL